MFIIKPIILACKETLSHCPPAGIAEHILNLTQWLDFRGYLLIPGIKSAEFEVNTPNFIGTQIRVTNMDGSTQAEEIVQWQPNGQLQFRKGKFSPLLSSLATGFVETWDFEWVGNETTVIRSFELNAE